MRSWSVGVLHRLALPTLVLRALCKELPAGLHGLPAVHGHPVGLCEEPQFSPGGPRPRREKTWHVDSLLEKNIVSSHSCGKIQRQYLQMF